jgi:general secretion pathway protein A
MFMRYFGFTEDPFEATPDPRCLYNSPTHQEALASLMFGFLSNRGFTALIAPPGLGKTTLLFRFLDNIRTTARTVFLFDSLCEPLDLVSAMLRDLGIPPGRNGVEMREQLKNVVVSEARAGRRFVVVIDEAQNMSDDALEMVRLLTNFETSRAKLIQIVLSGQPKLSDKLMQPSLEQLRQRISTYCRLEPLSEEQTAAYIDHRLKRAGYIGPPLFTQDALELITQASRGIPRTINNMCFNALSICYAMKQKQVDSGMATEAIADQQLVPQTEVVPASVAANAVRPREPERRRSAKMRKNWARVAAALIVGSVVSLAMSPIAKSLRTQVIADSRSLHDKILAWPLDASAASTSERGSAEATQNTASLQITVGPHQTLHDIAMQYLGESDEKSLRRIESLNPGVTNLDGIKAGEKLWLPRQPLISGIESTTSRAGSTIVHDAVPPNVEVSTGTDKGKHPKKDTASFEITVGPDQTLQAVCIQHLGEFDLRRLHQVEALNPRLTDPDHLEAGQKLRLPGIPEPPAQMDPTTVASARTSHEP